MPARRSLTRGRVLLFSAALALACGVGAAEETVATGSSLAGTYLVVVSDRDGYDSNVYGVSADGRRLSALTQDTADDRGVWVLPSGRWVAVSRSGPVRDAAVLVRTDGRGERIIGYDRSIDAVSPDERWVAVSTYGDRPTIELVPLAGGRVRNLGRGIPSTFSPDGKRLGFTDAGRLGVIEVADGRRTVARTGGRLQIGIAADRLDSREAEWWPTLKTVAAIRAFKPLNWDDDELVVFTIGRPIQSRVLARGLVGNVVWLGPRRLGFERVRDGGELDIVVSDTDGRGRRVIGRGARIAEWSRRAGQVAYSTGSALVVASLDSSSRRRINLPEAAVLTITWSPTGRWLAAGVETATGEELVIIDARRGTVRVRTRIGSTFPLADVVWSPDEATIAVGDDEIELVRAATGRVRRVAIGGEHNQIVGWVRATLPGRSGPARDLSPEVQTRSGFVARSRVQEIASAGTWVGAILARTRADCERVVAWKPSSRSIVRFGEASLSCLSVVFSLRQLDLAGTRLAWANRYCGNDCYLAECDADARVPGRYRCNENPAASTVPAAAPRPQPRPATRRGVEFSMVNGTIRLRRIADGRVRHIRPTRDLVDAELEHGGLFYAYNARTGRYRGHVVYLPYDEFFP